MSIEEEVWEFEFLWNDYFTHRNYANKPHHWINLPLNFLEHPMLVKQSPSVRWLALHIVVLCQKYGSTSIQLRTEYAWSLYGLRPKSVTTALQVLEKIGCISGVYKERKKVSKERRKEGKKEFTTTTLPSGLDHTKESSNTVNKVTAHSVTSDAVNKVTLHSVTSDTVIKISEYGETPHPLADRRHFTKIFVRLWESQMVKKLPLPMDKKWTDAIVSIMRAIDYDNVLGQKLLEAFFKYDHPRLAIDKCDMSPLLMIQFWKEICAEAGVKDAKIISALGPKEQR